MKKIFHILFHRLTIIILLVAIQVLFLVTLVRKFSSYYVYVESFLALLSIIIVIWLVSKKGHPMFKLAWSVFILTIPLIGGLFYLLFGTKLQIFSFSKELEKSLKGSGELLQQDEEILKEIEDRDVYNQMFYLSSVAKSPVYKNTTTKYLTPGEVKLESLLIELKKAKKFIFMEYFIVQEGLMWDCILEVLEEKVEQGVDVRVMYDDMGCIQTLPRNYDKRLREKGIKCAVFNSFKPHSFIVSNHRDHRKITVIDGRVAFNGGINLADEYINQKEVFGHWKDAAIMIEGDAVWSFTVMFLQLWEFTTKEAVDYEAFKVKQSNIAENGYVVPFGDSPVDRETVSSYVYMNVINKARKYVYINTPYLIIDGEMETALMLAAKNGVDVRIVTPHIPDKWYVHCVTQATYDQFIEAGIKIYEYTPGFIHSKTFVVDDEIAIVGTVNMDYRSLYLHFECATWLYKSSSVQELKDDFLETLEVCQEITQDDVTKVSISKRIIRSVIKLAAPLM